MSMFIVGDFVGVTKPSDTNEFPGWTPHKERFVGAVCEVMAVLATAPSCIQLKNPTPGNRAEWFRDSWCYLTTNVVSPVVIGNAAVNPGNWTYLPAVSNGQVFVTLPNHTHSFAYDPSDYDNDRAKGEKPREFDGYCNPCGGLRTHRLGCPTKRKST